jgi:hypothetical protein
LWALPVAMGCNQGGKGASQAKGGKGKGKGLSVQGQKASGSTSAGSKVKVGMVPTAKIEKRFEKLEAMMASLLEGSTSKKKAYWTCGSCGDERCFSSRKTCHACGAERDAQVSKAGQPQGKPSGEETKKGAQPAVSAVLEVDPCEEVALVVPPEQEVKELENLLKILKAGASSAKKDLLVASLQEELQAAKCKVLQARPLPVRLQAAVKRQEAAAAAVRGAQEAVAEVRALLMVKQEALNEANGRLQEAEREVAEVQAQLGRPQLEAGAAAAVTVCLAMLRQQGMSEDQLKAFDLALRTAFVSSPAPQTGGLVQMAQSPFTSAIGAESSQGSQVGSSAVPFSEGGGGFAQQGQSPFKGKSSGMQEEEQEKSRADALESLKLRLEVQKAKCSAFQAKLGGLREAAKKAEEELAGSGADLLLQAEEVVREAAAEQTLCAALENQRLEMENESFRRNQPNKEARSAPY